MGNDNLSTVAEDIAVIKNQLANLTENFKEYKVSSERLCEVIAARINAVEDKQIAADQKLSLLAGFQSVFSIIIGGIAAFLGTRR